eukprot:52539-Eustigmatos_ZCMA.PRE.1
MWGRRPQSPTLLEESRSCGRAANSSRTRTALLLRCRGGESQFRKPHGQRARGHLGLTNILGTDGPLRSHRMHSP